MAGDTANFVRVASVGDVPDPGRTLVEVDGDVVALFHVDGRFYAIDDVCTHDGGPLVEGELADFKIACPRHGAKFDIRTGAALTMPAVRATRSHEVKVEAGDVWVRFRQSAASDGPSAHASGSAAAFPTAFPTAAAAPAASTAAPATGGSGTAPAAGATSAASQSLSEDAVREMLKGVVDPELFVNIVDLGLIYGVTISPAADAAGKQHVAVDMTMTSPACPAGPQLIADAKRTVGTHADVSAVEVRIVMDPPWTPDRMTDAARDQLGIF
jgi:metal-sulfur cluster biosynthetic enzyme/nitrite reductase/ring-hydroxylating ferredoxin subunit